MKHTQKRITLIPVGGLANRMMAVESAIALSKETNMPLEIVWFKDWGLNSPFHKLFEEIPLPNVTIREAKKKDLLTTDRPRKKNLLIPHLFQLFKYQQRMYETEVFEQMKKGFDFANWCKNRESYIAAFCPFFPAETHFQHFRPTTELREEVQRITAKWHTHIVGVHIRRTDNIASIEGSPTEAFVRCMNKELDKHPDTHFYLATDSEEEKRKMKYIFGERIITSHFKAERGSVEGMQHAVLEMYLLASTNKILGSAKSTYSVTAAKISDIPYEIVTK